MFDIMSARQCSRLSINQACVQLTIILEFILGKMHLQTRVYILHDLSRLICAQSDSRSNGVLISYLNNYYKRAATDCKSSDCEYPAEKITRPDGSQWHVSSRAADLHVEYRSDYTPTARVRTHAQCTRLFFNITLGQPLWLNYISK